MNKYEELSKLKELLDAGVLSKEEFETKKKKILSGVGNVTPKKSKKYLVAIIIAIIAFFSLAVISIVEILMLQRRILTLHIKKVLKEVH